MSEKGQDEASSRCLLALDAAGARCSVVAWRHGRVLAEESAPMQRGQSEQLVPMALRAMERAALPWEELDSLAVTNGPGGFTGVRIGLAAAQGLALAWDLPVVTVSCFEAVRAAVASHELQGRWLVLLIEAKRAEVYVELIDLAGRRSLGPALMSDPALLEALPEAALLLAGDAAAAHLERLSEAGFAVALSRAAGPVSVAVVAALAAARERLQRPWPQPQPLYLREADTTLVKKVGRVP